MVLFTPYSSPISSKIHLYLPNHCPNLKINLKREKKNIEPNLCYLYAPGYGPIHWSGIDLPGPHPHRQLTLALPAGINHPQLPQPVILHAHVPAPCSDVVWLVLVLP